MKKVFAICDLRAGCVYHCEDLDEAVEMRNLVYPRCVVYHAELDETPWCSLPVIGEPVRVAAGLRKGQLI